MSTDDKTNGVQLLWKLAFAYGVQSSYFDVSYRRKTASTESLISMLRVLGAPINTRRDVPDAWREKRQESGRRTLEPVVVAWNGRPVKFDIRIPADSMKTRIGYAVNLESGTKLAGTLVDVADKIYKLEKIEGIVYNVARISLQERIPYGYHRLTLDVPGNPCECLIISSPVKAYSSPYPNEKNWGIFVPQYALKTRTNWGSGDFADLAELMSWTRRLGGDVIATLPLLTASFGIDGDPSPYRPSSRLMWNEFYINIDNIPDLALCQRARQIMSDKSFQNEIEDLRALPLVDYSRQMNLKGKVLEEMSRSLYEGEIPGLRDLIQFGISNPVVEQYARFQAVVDKQKSVWKSWPHRLRDGEIKSGDYDESAWRFHLYAQWQAFRQMTNISRKAAKDGGSLCLDLPLGVHPDGYDVWREPDVFVRDAQTGAPPDTVFTSGQNWEFPPLHPLRIREKGYRYVIDYLRHNLECAGILRVDHVMGFHRLYCIPEDIDSKDGVYMRYKADELYAILTLESNRHKTMIVGEDLGIVPRYVRPAMRKHGLKRMYVLRYELAEDVANGIHPVPDDSVASLNTHDMPMFASFWRGLDIEERTSLGLLGKSEAETERKRLPATRETLAAFLKAEGFLQGDEGDITSILKACLSALAASEAPLVLVNLEDLWLETRPQNIPGTRDEYPNWRRKMQMSYEEFCHIPQVLDILEAVDKIRQTKSKDKTKR